MPDAGEGFVHDLVLVGPELPPSSARAAAEAASSSAVEIPDAVYSAHAFTHGRRHRPSRSSTSSSRTSRGLSDAKGKCAGERVEPFTVRQPGLEQRDRGPIGAGQGDVEPLQRERVGSWVALGELEHDPVESLGGVAHRERREHALSDELHLVSERRVLQRRRRLVLERHDRGSAWVECSRSSRTTASVRSPCPGASDSPSTAKARITARPTSRSWCPTWARSIELAAGPPISRPARTSISQT